MQIICLSRGSYEFSEQLAEKLASNIGYTCISREMITDEATQYGIPVGKLEMAVMKKQPLSEAMAIEVDLFKAFVTAYLCERLQKENIVYHGRSGHLALPGVTNILRLRTISDIDSRIDLTMRQKGFNREQARQYHEQIDEDIHRWVRTFYNVNWEDPSLYDFTINVNNLSVDNAASALSHMANLPEYQETPDSKQILSDLWLAARCRLSIGRDEATHEVTPTVHAEKGNVSVTYLPRQAKAAEKIPSILEAIPEVKSLVCTVATTNIICIEEQFDPENETFDHLIEIAEKWNASIELVQLAGDSEEDQAVTKNESQSVSTPSDIKKNGGILDDTATGLDSYSTVGGIPEIMDKLIQVGRAGGFRTVSGGTKALIKNLIRNEEYSLVVVGNVFISKGAASKRMKRDLMSLIADKFHVPVIGTEDLKSQYLFGTKQLMSLVMFLLLCLGIYFSIFSFQEPILEFLSVGQNHASIYQKVIASVLVGVSIPIVAFTIGGFYSNLLKMFKFE